MAFIKKMRKVTIAIIDSGIDNRFKNQFKCKVSGIGVTLINNEIKIVEDYFDENGHGTLTASVIINECPDIEFFIIKILDRKLEGNIECLIASLEYLLDKDVNIINMSLAVEKNGRDSRLKKICKRLNDQGKILIAAVENGSKKSIPAIYSTVIAVEGRKLKQNVLVYCKNAALLGELYVPLTKDSIERYYQKKDDYVMYGDCNSFAAAKLSGKLARILRKQPSNDNSKVKKLLRKESKLFVWTVPLLNLFKEYPVFRDNNIIYDPIKLNKLATNIAVFFSVENISDIYSYSLYSSKISQKKEFAYRFLRFLEEKYGFVCENYSVFERNDFISIYSVYKFLKERYKW